MYNIVVSGGAGFIGSHLTDRLIELGHRVIVYDNLSTGKIENLNPKAKFIKYDISELYYFEDKVDYVFHLAAVPRVPYSVAHPSITHRMNVEGTYKILKVASDAKVKKFIFASSSSVYGDQELPLKETMRTYPKSPYALHKLIGEQYCKLFNELYGLPTVALRFFNVYGKRADPNSEYSLVIAKFLKYKKENRPFTIYGDGEQTRDFTYVDDVINACILAMEKLVQNEVINICNGRAVSINKIAKIIGGEKTFLPKRKGDIEHTLGSPEKAKDLLGWKPTIDIKKGIKLMEG